MAFSAKVQDVFLIPGKGTVLSLTEVDGEPVEGERFETALGEAVTLAVAEPGIRDRACLTGREVSRYGAILTNLPMPDAKSLLKNNIQTVEGLS